MVFACSGAADVGAITDLAARKLAAEKKASMCCAAAVAAGIPEILEKTTLASGVIVLDGCDKVCARKILENAGFADCTCLELGALGLEKGQSSPTDERVGTVVDAATEALAQV
jgi:uncharacterized metal-binding protein